MTAVRRIARTLAAAAVAAACLLVCAPLASAGALVTAAGTCAHEPLSKPFVPWFDFADYFHAPGGGLEKGASGWTLSGAAAVVSENESFNVHGAKDKKSLELRKGAVATSPVTCVGIDRPALRFFLRQAGGPQTSYVRVDALFEDALGATRSLTIGALGATGSWQPTPPVVITASLLPLLPGAQTPVAFRFAAVGGTFLLDDVYVDPYGGR